MKILLIIILICVIWINIDNFIVKRKVTHLTDKVEELSKIANLKFNLPKEELPDEAKMYYLKNQIDSLETVILNRNC